LSRFIYYFIQFLFRDILTSIIKGDKVILVGKAVFLFIGLG